MEEKISESMKIHKSSWSEFLDREEKTAINVILNDNKVNRVSIDEARGTIRFIRNLRRILAR